MTPRQSKHVSRPRSVNPKRSARLSRKETNMTVEHVTKASGNVFADLGLPNADELLAKSKLAAVMQRSITELGLKQIDAANRMGIPQPKLSRILRGRFEGISETYIADGLRKLGHDVDFRISPRHEGIGHSRVI